MLVEPSRITRNAALSQQDDLHLPWECKNSKIGTQHGQDADCGAQAALEIWKRVHALTQVEELAGCDRRGLIHQARLVVVHKFMELLGLVVDEGLIGVEDKTSLRLIRDEAELGRWRLHRMRKHRRLCETTRRIARFLSLGSLL